MKTKIYTLSYSFCGINNLTRVFKDGKQITFMLAQGLVTFHLSQIVTFHSEILLAGTCLNIICKSDLYDTKLDIWYLNNEKQLTLFVSPEIYYELLSFMRHEW